MARRRLVPLALAPLLLVPAPARADYFTVHLDIVEWPSRTAAAACAATAETSAAGYVAVATTVECRIDDLRVSWTAPGSRAASAVANSVGSTFLICVSGSASFASSTGRVFVEAPERCTAYNDY